MHRLALVLAATPAASAERPRWALVIRGGAGVIERSAMTPATDAAYRTALTAGLAHGRAVLDGGGPALDAVEAVIRELEDDPLFNAGAPQVAIYKDEP